jgi:hypothetical protein
MEKYPLDELFRAKLHDWEAAPSDRALAKLQAQLGQTAPRRWGAYWRVAAVLLCVLAGGAWLLWPPTQPGPAPVAQKSSQTEAQPEARLEARLEAQPQHAGLDSPQKVTPAEKFSGLVQPAGPEPHLLSSNRASGAANRPPATNPVAKTLAEQPLTQPGAEAKVVAETSQPNGQESQPVAQAQPNPEAANSQPDDQVAKPEAQAARGGQKIQVTIRMGTEAAGREELEETQEQHRRRRTGMGKLLSKLNGGEPDAPGDEVEIKLLGVSKDSLFKKKDKKNR